MIDTKEVLGRLRALRTARRLKQEDVAERLGIDRTTYLRKEGGYIPLATEEWLSLASILGVEPLEFFLTPDSRMDETTITEKEKLLVRVYRLLNHENKRDLLFSIRLVLKGVEDKDLKDSLDRLVTD
jgi:transcriptional regulator with XRE-family HTH domain